ncbi:ComEC/Rec2 family competence protein [Clostridium sp. OS1-26]|uniref:ComEC/Rec2 family competence protein n=1 Tax=Clostridium sp. OS1-26 TaxID=3070681 RepID=UPI0027DFDCFA|nr:ComEC/Rec2 family competence protein [Clostridium sp. OS1-26]WML37464.1 ComEC/Rec2 family competence protein [Clostridium sp. OS1-26]
MKKRIVYLLSIFTIAIFIITGCGNTQTTNTTNNQSTSTTTVPSGQLKVHYINVGQGDGILIQQGTHHMLIDAGTNEDEKLMVDYLNKQDIKHLDYIVGTHPHEDHIGGLDAVIKNFDIGTVYMPKVTTTTKTFADVINALKAKNLKITTPIVGSTFKLGDANCEILAPNSSKYQNINDYSIVIKLTYGSNKFLFTGDAENLSEKEILSKGLDVSADVLKLGHHGSFSSTSAEFLDKVNPKYAVVSCGKDNDYGHPHDVTMKKLEKKHIPLYRTDESGNIICTSDGKNISFNVKSGDYKPGKPSKTNKTDN